MEVQNLLYHKIDGFDGDIDDAKHVLGIGNWGLKGLKTEAKSLIMLCCEHDLQGCGFPVGAPKPPLK